MSLDLSRYNVIRHHQADQLSKLVKNRVYDGPSSVTGGKE